MAEYILPIQRLIEEFRRIPGVGAKTAARYAYYIINSKVDDVMNFVEALKEVKSKVKFCEVCGNFTDATESMKQAGKRKKIWKKRKSCFIMLLPPYQKQENGP